MGDTKVCGPNPPFLALVVGQKNTGKSILIKWICRQYAADFSYIVVFTPTSLSGFYQEFLPAAHIHPDYDEEVLKKIMAKQEEFKRHGKPVQCLVIFDDVIGSQTAELEKRKNNILNTVWVANRHWNLSCLVVTQVLKAVPTKLRQNIDYCFILRTMLSAHATIYEAFGHMDKKSFEHFLETNTSDYKIIRYKSAVKNKDEHYSVFSIPAEFLRTKFKLMY